MLFKEITNFQEWEDFVLKQDYVLFVQSYHYAEFYRSLGEKSWIFGIYEGDVLVGGSLVVSTHAKRGNFLYLPYGPILDFQLAGRLQQFVEFLKNFAKENKYDFIRISPFIDDTAINKKIFASLGFRDSPMHIIAETTCLLNLELDEAELLNNMQKNHRNLIRRCEKEGVIIKKFNTPEAVKEFNKLHDITARRHNFHRFSNEYVTKEFFAFISTDESLIWHAYLRDKTLDSSAVIMYYGNMAAYRHGASLNTYHKIPTSYLLQWEAIKEAKKRGLKWYNFWGIAPEEASSSHPFKGITHFKKGFGGKQKDLLHCQDLPITKKYWLNWGIETLRRIKRGF